MLSFAAHIEDWTRSKKKRNMLWTKQISSMEYRQDFRIWALTLIVNILPEIVLVHDMSRQMVLHFCYVQQTIILSKFLCHKKYYVYFETSFNCTQRRWYCTCMHIIPGQAKIRTSKLLDTNIIYFWKANITSSNGLTPACANHFLNQSWSR